MYPSRRPASRRIASRRIAVVTCALAGVAGTGLLPGQAAAAVSAPQITEIHYDNVGSDVGEAVEVQAPAGFDLTGWTLVRYNGSVPAAALTYGSADALSGTSGTSVVTYPADGLQNGGNDGVALVRPDGSVAELLSYEGVLTAANGPAAGLSSTDIGVAESSGTPVGQSLQKIDGVWTGPLTSTFGGGSEPVPAKPATIAEVQGTGAASPIVGTLVLTQGVVTADHRTGGFGGFYLQTAGTGGSTHGAASDGVFVFTGSAAAQQPDIAIGDLVSVTGTVAEYNGLTEITTTKAGVIVLAAAQPVPVAVPLTLPLDDAGRESLEGMLVAPVGTYTVTDTYDLNYFGEVGLHVGDSPALIGTEVAEPGNAANAVEAQNKLETIVLDDGVTANLFTAGLTPPYFGQDGPVRVGDHPSFGPTVLSYGFGAYKLEPTTPVTAATPAGQRTTFDDSNPRRPAPTVAGDVKVAGFNVLNYFTTLGIDLGCEPDMNPCDARGAYDAAQLSVQRSKIVAAINQLGADVVTLEEVENSAKFGQPIDTTLADLVAGLNAAAGAGTWDYVRAPANLPDVALLDFIKSAIIYQPAKVSLQGDSTALADQSDAGEAFANAREPIAQSFVPGNGGPAFTVVANHFKSKGSGTGADADQGDGQGASNLSRVHQATALRDWVAALQASTGVQDVLMLGDFNAYRYEDPIDVLTAAGFVDLGAQNETGVYSYSFDGRSGSLDHIFASPSAAARVQGFAVWDLNASESTVYEYEAAAQGLVDPQSPFRSSDHSPEIVGLSSVPACTRTISGTYNGPLVATGVTCVSAGAVLNGPVQVRAGAALRITRATVRGPISASSAAAVSIDSSTVLGPVSVVGTTGGTALTASTVSGPVRLDANRVSTMVSGNTINGPLTCAGNTPPPTATTPNVVRGPAAGQCAGLRG